MIGLDKSVSVVLSTFNGERFILKQLNSLLMQTMSPDEVIIVDDDSSDRTYEIILDFINKNGLTNWRCYKNEINIGWRNNFIKGMNLTKGDIIFFSDQDDVWDENKIKIMAKILCDNPSIKVLGCNLNPFFEEDCSNKDKRKYLRERKTRKDTLTLDRQSINDGVYTRRQGCATCFCSSLIPFVNKIWFKDYSHDGVVWAVGIVTDSAFIFNKALVNFRRHGSNNTPKNLRKRDYRIGIITNETILLDRIIDNSDFLELSLSTLDTLKKKKEFNSSRIDSLRRRRIIPLLRFVFKRSFNYSFFNFCADVACFWNK